jgi:hypothetical protein
MSIGAAKLLISGTVSISQTMTLVTMRTFNGLTPHESILGVAVSVRSSSGVAIRLIRVVGSAMNPNGFGCPD